MVDLEVVMRRQGWGSSRRLSFAERLEIQDRVRAGERFDVVAEAMGCSTKSVQRLLNRTGGIAPRVVARSSRRIGPGEREEISHPGLETVPAWGWASCW